MKKTFILYLFNMLSIHIRIQNTYIISLIYLIYQYINIYLKYNIFNNYIIISHSSFTGRIFIYIGFEKNFRRNSHYI